MKNEIWNGNKIRFVEINDEWCAVANDIARAMNFADSHTALRKMPSKYKGRYKVPDQKGVLQETTVLTEKGLYRLIMRSNKPEAEEFQDWVFNVIKTLREETGLQGFEVFRMLDKEHQKAAMNKLRNGLKRPVRVNFIKANTVANKAISNKYDYPKMITKGEMTPQMLAERESVLDDTVQLMELQDKYGLDLSVSKTIYAGIK